MDAHVKTIREIFHSGDQFLVPFFQRHYSWRKEHWQRLLDDIMALIDEAEGTRHFLGPLVCTPLNPVPGEVTPYQLILLRARADQAMDVVNLKISKLGGLTKIRQARDLCVSMGIAMTLEDSWGSDIVTAAIAHLGHSTPPEFLFSTTDFNSYVTVSTAEGAPRRVNGRMAASTKPGLGLEPRMNVLGKPVVEIA